MLQAAVPLTSYSFTIDTKKAALIIDALAKFFTRNDFGSLSLALL